MKNLTINRKSAFLMACFFCLNLCAQGFQVYTKDGSRYDFFHTDVDSIVFSDKSVDEDFRPTDFPVAEIVDLGLSVNWASWNVGANSPEGYGRYYAWGEMEEKSVYDWENYKWYKDGSLTKYCEDDWFGIVDNKGVLELSDDVAYTMWGGGWRMPTEEEFRELMSICKWEYITDYNGTSGLLVTGPNGNSIFLPAAGCRYEEDIQNVGNSVFYFSTSLVNGDSNHAYSLKGGTLSDNAPRCYGCPVRPVFSEGNGIKTGAATSITTKSAVLSGHVDFENNSEPFSVGVCYNTKDNPVADNSTVVFSDVPLKVGKFSVSLEGLSSGTTYYYRSFLKKNGNYVYGKVYSFTTAVHSQPSDAVDLGLSVKWASWNVGATSPEEPGGYFSWGETEEKNMYKEVSYKYYDSEKGYIDIVPFDDDLGTSDISGVEKYDAARLNWGGKWRMPTLEEFKELREKCDWTWTEYNGVLGYLIKGNGNSIFLPATGYRLGIGLSNDNSYRGHYWSSTDASYFYFYDRSFTVGKWKTMRSGGLTIRPVMD